MWMKKMGSSLCVLVLLQCMFFFFLCVNGSLKDVCSASPK